ncbi:Probable diguanylate cyclase YcdT [Pannonibacter phragmitetus]|uniref:diguanylate cyclase n=1 Tax=Pannonibacter phragmitetus TaxID=121719 RepID=A0A378ZTN3_9HYPH|nr:GGDEF domain-containing protein [Pannonibacter phragmitetus]SUA99911.1 Probable diguanylate cyclase YcdT [Pannonibacter phragmitetus]
MQLDVVTLSTAVTLMLLMGAGMLMLVFRFSVRRPSAHADSVRYWAVALGLMGAGIFLVSLRGHIPDFSSIAAGNGIILLAMSLRLRAIKMFWNKHESWMVTAAPASLWTSMCLVPVFYDNFLARVVLVNSLVILLLLASIQVTRKYNHDRLRSAKWLRDSMAFEVLSKMAMALGFSLAGLDSFDAALRSNMTAIYLLTLIISTLATIISAFAMIIEREERLLREQALRDPLTELSNRRAFFDDAGRWLEKHAFAGKPFAVALFDLDHFKQVNDLHGHAAGDEMLTIFADVLRENTRKGDFAARLGGEEFAVFLPDTDIRTLEAVADRLRSDFAEKALRRSGGAMPVTVSAGIAAGRSGANGLEQTLATADRGLYSAKRAGRNMVRNGHDKPVTGQQEEMEANASVIQVLHLPVASAAQ